MSIPLTDFRCKITPEVDALLETLHRTTGRDKSEIARDVLHKWAVTEIHAAMLLHVQLQDKGILRDYEGALGQ
jgi:hypothetical protein